MESTLGLDMESTLGLDMQRNWRTIVIIYLPFSPMFCGAFWDGSFEHPQGFS